MEATGNLHWFLSKPEAGSVFGPMPFNQVGRWAAAVQVASHDKLARDQLTWLKAPLLPELEMNWLVEVTGERYYGGAAARLRSVAGAIASRKRVRTRS
jgi:hypothetical protein